MRKILMLTVVCALLAPAAAEAATVPVQSLNGDFAASNSTVTKTPDGVHFGPYANGGAVGGTLIYNGVNGRTLSQLTDSRTRSPTGRRAARRAPRRTRGYSSTPIRRWTLTATATRRTTSTTTWSSIRPSARR
jgi:hypothetical protein